LSAQSQSGNINEITDISDAVTPEMVQAFAAQTGNPLIDIINGNVPLGNMLGRGIAWSLLNLMMSVIAILNTVILLVTLFIKKRETDNEHEDDIDTYDDDDRPQDIRTRLLKLKIPALLTGIIPGILFLLLENIRLPVTWITQWTPIIGAFFIIHMALVIIHYMIKRRVNTEDEDDEKQEVHS